MLRSQCLSHLIDPSDGDGGGDPWLMALASADGSEWDQVAMSDLGYGLGAN